VGVVVVYFESFDLFDGFVTSGTLLALVLEEAECGSSI
jgi:hypothetical protein